MQILFRPNYIESEKVRFDFFKEDVKKEVIEKNIKDAKLLDIWCYQDSFKFENNLVHVYWIDKSIPGNYNLENFKKCDLDKESIPFKNETFDFIIAWEIIEHIKRPFEFIENISHLLKPNWILYLSTPTPYYYMEILKELFWSEVLDDDEHLNLFSTNHLVNYCKKNKLRLIWKWWYKFWIPFIKLMIVRIGIPRFLSYQIIYKFQNTKVTTKVTQIADTSQDW